MTVWHFGNRPIAATSWHSQRPVDFSLSGLPDTPDPIMPSLLVTIFAVELVVQLVNSVGAAAINDLVSDWSRDPKLPPGPARLLILRFEEH